MNNRIAVSFTIVDFMNGTPIPVDAWATVRPNHIGVDGKPRPYRVLLIRNRRRLYRNNMGSTP